ncbi:hypothetical protein [Leptolyngbya sp. FACHB-711]|nr:hypothetical protein [Leptolyngbya sp. FACHB-711]MBD1848804.1 hypothetical protein [Cyanobacteria bacterium FACHB-502]MBD2027149.1 hypothetical protein [Leptolyngbya sp. FACHB-711]
MTQLHVFTQAYINDERILNSQSSFHIPTVVDIPAASLAGTATFYPLFWVVFQVESIDDSD